MKQLHRNTEQQRSIFFNPYRILLRYATARIIHLRTKRTRPATVSHNIRLHFHGLTSYEQLNSFGAKRQKKLDRFFFCVLGCKSCEILRTAWGRLTFAVECHVARCQFQDDHHFSFTLVCPCFMCKKNPMKTEVRMLHWAVYTIQAKRKARSGAQDDALDCCIQFTW